MDPIMDMHTELQKVQMNRDASGLRLRDSKEHVEEMEKMLHLLEKVQITKRHGDQRLQKAEEEALILNSKVRSLEKTLKEFHRLCSVQCLHYSTVEKSNDERRHSNLPSERDFKKEFGLQHTNLKLPRHPLNQEWDEVSKEESVHNLIDGIGQKMAVLSDKFSFLEEHLTCFQSQLLNTQEGHCLSQHLASVDKHRQQAAQCCSTSHNHHHENVLLNNQLNYLKLEILHLKTNVDHYKLSLAALKHEKSKLKASEAEHVRRVQEEILAKQQLSINLEMQGLQLLALTEEHKELQLLYSCKIKESEGVVLQLQSHLKHVQTELDQVKCTLRTLKQKDDQGFQVARSMQKEITSRRRQIDSLQSKIHHLEEIKENLCQEKVFWNLKNKHQFQELELAQTEKKQLAEELETVKSRDKHLREHITELEAVVCQLSAGFADCHEFIQQQEQEYYRLKLKHVLDQKQVIPSSDLVLLSGTQHGIKKHQPHTFIAATSVHRRRPAPESMQSTAHRSPHLKTEKLQHILIRQEPFTSTPATTTTSPQLLGRRSPVHMLLTSKPNS